MLMGSLELALTMQMEVLETQRRVFGSEDSGTLMTMGNVATLRCSMGNDELVLTGVFNLGAVLGNAGDHAAATPLLHEALAGQIIAGFTVAYGPEHPHVTRIS